MNILSLFDGISCARLAVERNGVKVNKYYTSEVDKYASAISQHQFPDNIQLGDVKGVTADMVEDIDLLIGGSPCQDLSIAKRGREGLEGTRSGLFWEYVRILKEVKPKYFVLENVNSMPKEARDKISEALGVEPIMINASLVSAQQRRRLFWTNIEGVELPEDKGIKLNDILEHGHTERDKSLVITATYARTCLRDYFTKGSRQLVFNKPVRVGRLNKGGQGGRVYSVNGKSICLSADGDGRGAKTVPYEMNKHIRKLTPIECERLQSVPDNFTLVPHPVLKGMMSNAQRYKTLGNAFNVDVVAHILKQIK